MKVPSSCFHDPTPHSRFPSAFWAAPPAEEEKRRPPWSDQSSCPILTSFPSDYILSLDKYHIETVDSNIGMSGLDPELWASHLTSPETVS